MTSKRHRHSHHHQNHNHSEPAPSSPSSSPPDAADLIDVPRVLPFLTAHFGSAELASRIAPTSAESSTPLDDATEEEEEEAKPPTPTTEELKEFIVVTIDGTEVLIDPIKLVRPAPFCHIDSR